MLNTFIPCQNLAKPNNFGDICEKLLSDPCVLFLVPTAKIPKGTFILSLVPVGQVMSEEKIFERNDIKKGKKKNREKWEVILKWLDRLK